MITIPILLVEDEENDVLFFQRAVIKAGIGNPVHVARDGQEAIDYLRGVGKFDRRVEFPLPRLVLLDLKLPFVMGLEVLEWIRQRSGLAPIVVILSSSREEADIASAYGLGANGYLVKPAEASLLGDMVRAINDFWLRQNTLQPNCQVGGGMVSAANLPDQGVDGQRCSPAVSHPLNPRQKRALQPKPGADPALSRRQTEVLQLIAEGHTSKQIARLLSLNTKTVEKHRQAVMDKLDIHEIATLTRYAISRGIVESNFNPLARSGARPSTRCRSGLQNPTLYWARFVKSPYRGNPR